MCIFIWIIGAPTTRDDHPTLHPPHDDLALHPPPNAHLGALERKESARALAHKAFSSVLSKSPLDPDEIKVYGSWVANSTTSTEWKIGSVKWHWYAKEDAMPWPGIRYNSEIALTDTIALTGLNTQHWVHVFVDFGGETRFVKGTVSRPTRPTTEPFSRLFPERMVEEWYDYPKKKHKNWHWFDIESQKTMHWAAQKYTQTHAETVWEHARIVVRAPKWPKSQTCALILPGMGAHLHGPHSVMLSQAYAANGVCGFRMNAEHGAESASDLRVRDVVDVVEYITESISQENDPNSARNNFNKHLEKAGLWEARFSFDYLKERCGCQNWMLGGHSLGGAVTFAAASILAARGDVKVIGYLGIGPPIGYQATTFLTGLGYDQGLKHLEEIKSAKSAYPHHFIVAGEDTYGNAGLMDDFVDGIEHAGGGYISSVTKDIITGADHVFSGFENELFAAEANAIHAQLKAEWLPDEDSDIREDFDIKKDIKDIMEDSHVGMVAPHAGVANGKRVKKEWLLLKKPEADEDSDDDTDIIEPETIPLTKMQPLKRVAGQSLFPPFSVAGTVADEDSDDDADITEPDHVGVQNIM